MAQLTQEISGGTAVATVLSVGTTPLTVVGSSQFRRAVSIYAAGGPVYLGYPSAAPSQGLPLASGATRDEQHYAGQLQVVAAVAGPVSVFVIDIS